MTALAKSVQYSVRGVPSEVDQAIRRKAARLKISLNQLILDELSRALLTQPQRADFSDVAGKWVPDPGFDEMVSAQRQIDWKKWR